VRERKKVFEVSGILCFLRELQIVSHETKHEIFPINTKTIKFPIRVPVCVCEWKVTQPDDKMYVRRGKMKNYSISGEETSSQSEVASSLNRLKKDRDGL